jgi:hypothetical protein
MEQDRDPSDNLFNFNKDPQQPEQPPQPLEPPFSEEQPATLTGGARDYPAPEPYQPAPYESMPLEPAGPATEYVPPPPTGPAREYVSPPPAPPASGANRTWLIVAIILVVLCCCCLALAVAGYFWAGDAILCQLDPTFCP